MLAEDSFFINIEAHDYHLLCGSAPVNSGVDISQVATDFEGTPRIIGTFDIGADELLGEVGDVTWDDGSGNNLWSDPINWDPALTPSECSSVLIGNTFSVTVDSGGKIRLIEIQQGSCLEIPLGIELFITGK